MLIVILISCLVVVSQALPTDPSNHNPSADPSIQERHILQFIAAIIEAWLPKPPQQNGTQSAEWSAEQSDEWNDDWSISNSTEWTNEQNDFADVRSRNISSEINFATFHNFCNNIFFFF